MELKKLKETAIELMDALQQRGLGEVEIEQEGVRIRIKSAPPAPVSSTVVQNAGTPATPSAGPAAEEPAPADEEPEAEQPSLGTPVAAPMVGTFYSSASPDAPPFVLVGQRVRQGDTLFIIEAMKIMNEVKAPCDGTVVRILAQPGDLVEYNQTVVIIE